MLFPMVVWSELTPVFEYSFPASFDGTSTAIVDLSAAGNNGTMDNARGYLAGDVPPGGTGGSITGSSGGHGRTDAIDLLENADVAAHGGFTMDVWFYWPGTYTNVRKLLDYAGTEHLSTISGTIRFMISNSASQTIAVPIESGKWYHVIAEFDCGGNAVEADGKLYGESRLWLDDLSGDGLVLAASASTYKSIYGDSLNRPIGINRWAGGGGDWNQGKIYNPAVYLGINRTTSWNPTPANNATLVSIATDLSWMAPDVYVASGYNVYFDPNQSKVEQRDVTTLLAENIAETNYSFDDSLGYETTYYWRVDAFEPNATGDDILHDGKVWTFTTEPEFPVVDTHPQDQILAEGEMALFTVSGRNQTDYAWYYSEDEILEPESDESVGGNSATLAIGPVSAENEGYIYCVLSNGVGNAVSQPALLMTRRLVGRWEFENTLADTLGDHDGVAFGDPNYAADSIAGGQALLLNGASAVEIPYSQELNTESFTVMAWANLSGGAGAYRALVSNRNDVPKRSFILYAASSDNWQFWTPTITDAWTALDGGAAELDTWVFIACSFEADGPADEYGYVTGTKSLYINGLKVAEQLEADYTRNIERSLLIGAGANELPDHDYFFQGQIDDVQLYNYALDPFALAEAYVRVIPEAKLCVSYPMMDITGPNGEPDCRVDLLDLALFAADWMECNIVSTTGDCQ